MTSGREESEGGPELDRLRARVTQLDRQLAASGSGRLEQRYRALTDSMPQMVWATDADGAHFYYNRQWYEYTGLSEERSLGFGFTNALHPDDLERTLARWQRAWKHGEPYEIEYRFRRHDGVYHWFIGRALPVRDQDGKIVEWVGTCTNIDEQKRNSEGLAFLADASRLLADSLDYETTLTRLAHLAVPRIADWCAIDILEAGGEVRRLAVAHVDPEKVALAHELYRRAPYDADSPSGVAQVMRSGQSELIEWIDEAVVRAAIADPELCEIVLGLGLRSSMVVALNARGRNLGALTLVSAESGRRFTPNDLRLAEDLARRAAVAIDNARLYSERLASEAALRARSEELGRISATLAERNRELDQFAYVTSHDLKAPLRGIINLAGWIEEDLGEVPEEIRGHLELLRGRVRRMEELINGLLHYSRVGRTSGTVAEVDVGELLGDVIDLLAPPPGAVVSVDPEMPVLRTDRLLLQQVFANLIGNAIKHARTSEPRVRVSHAVVDGLHRFAVADNGPGIAPQYHERIFGIFQTLAPRDEVEGSGLGLALVRKIIEYQGGSVWLESEEGQGATFFFTWPAG